MMTVLQTFKFHFEIEGNVYNFNIDAVSLEDAKRILSKHMATMIEYIK